MFESTNIILAAEQSMQKQKLQEDVQSPAFSRVDAEAMVREAAVGPADLLLIGAAARRGRG